MSLSRIVKDVVAHLEFEADEGRAALSVKPGTVASLGRLRNHPNWHDPAEEDADETAAPSARRLAEVAGAVAQCRKCPLNETRTKTVPGQGNPAPEIMFIGEAPGADEDEQGLAFVGRAGQLLTKMIEGMGLTRDEVFIANILKCRPPENRKPLPEEVELCLPYLKQQIAILKPKVIVALGATAVFGLLGLTTGITQLRGKWLSFEGVQMMPTFHPSYLLRNQEAKRPVWEDLKEVLRFLGRTPPERAGKPQHSM